MVDSYLTGHPLDAGDGHFVASDEFLRAVTLEQDVQQNALTRDSMFPIGDDNSDRRSFPLVTYALIAVNVLFFLFELSGGDAFVKQWAFLPSRFLANPAADFPTLFTSMFMHAGWVHLGGNM